MGCPTKSASGTLQYRSTKRMLRSARVNSEVGSLRHTFTHFHLDLSVRAIMTEAEPQRGAFVPRAGFQPAALPTLMRKVWDTATARAVEWGGHWP